MFMKYHLKDEQENRHEIVCKCQFSIKFTDFHPSAYEEATSASHFSVPVTNFLIN